MTTQEDVTAVKDAYRRALDLYWQEPPLITWDELMAIKARYDVVRERFAKEHPEADEYTYMVM